MFNKTFECAYCLKRQKHTWYTTESPVVKDKSKQYWFVCNNKCLFEVLRIFYMNPYDDRNITLVSAK